ncbi:MAG TPA: choice-of-anchor tandem repeat GloVer-containing protein [Candidatus Tumulicola sp.]
MRPARVLFSYIALFGIVGCGDVSVPVAAIKGAPSQATVDARSGHFRLLHAFGKSPDGAAPSGGLTALDGSLFGLTQSGGKSGVGTVYSLSITGKEKVLHSFDYSGDGYTPEGELLAYNGVLYGTIAAGQNFYGDVYSITKNGSFDILHKFSGIDGVSPDAGLTEVEGMLYGTTLEGGTHNNGGTVYAVSPGGGESVIYSFGAQQNDGNEPICKLTFWKNKLYGTTNGGGAYNGGTVFSLTTSGEEAVLHSFGEGTDGKAPDSSNVTPLGGALYGTTYQGGKYGKGIVFKMLPSGEMKTLYSFGGKIDDGSYPESGVIAYRGSLYGTTQTGGASDYGTIFRVTLEGKETTLFSFDGGDGRSPWGRLLAEGSNLYGTTFTGGPDLGTYLQGGTAFRFTP